LTTKYVYTDEMTVVQKVEEITDANTNTTGLQETHLTGQFVGIDICHTLAAITPFQLTI